MSINGPGPECFAAAQVMLADYLGCTADDSVLITTDTQGDQVAVQALVAAGLSCGTRPSVFVLPQLPLQGKLADPYLPATLAGAVAHADIWIDLTFPYIAGSDMHAGAMKAGRVKYMLCSDMTGGAMARLFSGVDLDSYFAAQGAFDSLMGAAEGRSVRITTALGTDVTFALAAPGIQKPRRAQGPGMYLIPGACTMTPEIESVKGRIVVETTFHEYYTPLPTPITVEVDGRIRSVRGGGTELLVFERALRRASGEGDYGYVIHFTHGLHPAARYSGHCFIEDMRVMGSDAIGFGLPWWVPGGGENHPDAVLSMQSIWLDGEQIVADGRIVAPDDMAQIARELRPRHA